MGLSNLPPGVSDSTYGAPWNDEEIETTLLVDIGTVKGIILLSL